MPKLELTEGESITVTFDGTDGAIDVAFWPVGGHNIMGHKLSIPEGGIVVHADLPDKLGRSHIIYHEPLGEEIVHGAAVSAVKLTSVPPQPRTAKLRAELKSAILGDEVSLSGDQVYTLNEVLSRLDQLAIDVKKQGGVTNNEFMNSLAKLLGAFNVLNEV